MTGGPIPSDLEIRDLTPQDVDDWATFFHRVSAQDSRVDPWSPGALQACFTDDFGVDGPHSIAGAWSGDLLVGYARVFQLGDSTSRVLHLAGAVAPHWRRRGVGTRLLRWSVNIATQWAGILGPVVGVADAATSDTDLQRILVGLGFDQTAHFVEMDRALPGDPLPVPTADVQLMAYDCEHESGPLGVHRNVRGEDADAEFSDAVTSANFQPELSRIALDPNSGAALGYVLVHHAPGDDQGWIEALAVRRSERGRDITTSLVVAALTGMRQTGLTGCGIGLTVDTDETQVEAACGGLGFSESLRWTRFVRLVDLGA